MILLLTNCSDPVAARVTRLNFAGRSATTKNVFKAIRGEPRRQDGRIEQIRLILRSPLSFNSSFLLSFFFFFSFSSFFLPAAGKARLPNEVSVAAKATESSRGPGETGDGYPIGISKVKELSRHKLGYRGPSVSRKSYFQLAIFLRGEALPPFYTG